MKRSRETIHFVTEKIPISLHTSVLRVQGWDSLQNAPVTNVADAAVEILTASCTEYASINYPLLVLIIIMK